MTRDEFINRSHEFQQSIRQFSRRLLWVLVGPVVLLVIGLLVQTTSIMSTVAHTPFDAGGLIKATDGLLSWFSWGAFAVIFLTLFLIPILILRCERKHGVRCPACGKYLTRDILAVLQTNNCQKCGVRVLDET